MRSIIWIVPVLLMVACQVDQNSDTSDSNSDINEPKIIYPKVLSEGLKAHDLRSKWTDMRTLEYTLNSGDKTERHVTDLQNRKVCITHADYTVGFDGNDVWITPDRAAFGDGNPRFYHNLYFYFFAMPFVLADPGIKYKVLPERLLHDKNYSCLRIRFLDHVGDAPEDEYIALFNPETHIMEYLLYTVTYFDGKPSQQYHALHYNEWQNVNGIILPKTITRMEYENGKIGAKKYDRTFSDVKISTEVPNSSQFEKPAGAEVAPLEEVDKYEIN